MKIDNQITLTLRPAIVITLTLSCLFFVHKPANSGDAETSVGVEWSKFRPEVKERIQNAVENQDCDALKKEKDIAYSNSDLHQGTSGISNSDLIRYITHKMQEAHCFGVDTDIR